MQLAYGYEAPEGVLGLMTEDITKYIDTVIPQAVVKTGKLLTADTTVGKVRNAARLPVLAAEITKPAAMGILILDSTKPDGLDWAAFRPAPVMRRGRIWVTAESAVTRWTHPFVRFASGAGGAELGSFGGSADSGSAAVLTHAIYLTDADLGGLVLLEINLF